MNVLGIETSCDETAVSVVRDGHEVLANAVSSQVSLHAGYGGVVPELAAREHLKAMQPMLDVALQDCGLGLQDLDAVAVTNGPGLIPALLVGNAFAKGLALAADCPFIGVNHFIAHIYGAFIGRPDLLADPSAFPILALVVSGGHTALVVIQNDGQAEIVGMTLDDAAGEAFDKGAKILDLGYPGGPIIDKIAKTGNPEVYDFPRGLTGGGGKPVAPENRFNFSFSGLKTALLYAVRDRSLSDTELADAVASYQQAIVDVLVAKTTDAARHLRTPTVCLCGGVACNSQLRTAMRETIESDTRNLVIAEPRYCTDNAAMVGGVAYHYLQAGRRDDLDAPVSARLGADLGVVPFTPERARKTR